MTQTDDTQTNLGQAATDAADTGALILARTFRTLTEQNLNVSRDALFAGAVEVTKAVIGNMGTNDIYVALDGR